MEMRLELAFWKTTDAALGYQARPQLARCKSQDLPLQKKKGGSTWSYTFCYIASEKKGEITLIIGGQYSESFFTECYDGKEVKSCCKEDICFTRLPFPHWETS